MRFDVIGIGENSVDVVCRVPAAVGPNTKLPILARQLLPGGQVATTLATCASLGLRTAYVGAFGDDSAGTLIRDTLQRRGVDVTACVTRTGVRTRSAIIVVDERTGDRTILWDRDRQLDLRADELPLAEIVRARALHVDQTDPGAALAAARSALDAGVVITSDIDDVSDRTAALIDVISAPIFAERVPQLLTGEHDPERALRALWRPHHQMICVTLGTRGAMLLDGRRVYRAPAFAVDVVDSTGAGDVFRGAFIAALLRGDTPADILRFANAAAAISCTRQGALDSVPTRDETAALLGR
jgi:sugar/nucleoside kinase (ribokinase family)